jgi:predicted MFS family arabinose efflux permease
MVSIFAVNADLFEARERARYQSYSSLVLMASGAIGPLLGGTMSDLFGWRSIFLVNVPIGFIVLTGLAFMLPYRKPHRRPKIDYAGALLLAMTTTSIVLAADSSELFGSLVSTQSLSIVAFGVVCAIVWVFVERRAPEPIVPLPLFRNSTFSLLLVMSIMSGAIAIGMVNYFALFLQTTTGLSPSGAGVLFILLTGGLVCGSLSAGRIISKTGRYKPFAIASLTCSATAFALFSQVHAGTPIAFIGAIMALHGIGIGLAQQVPVIGVQNAAPARDVGAATGSVTLSRMGGASIAISIYGAIIASQLSRIGVSIPGVTDIEQLTPKMLAALPEATRQAVADAYASAFSPLFMTSCAIALIGLAAAVMLKPVQLPRADEVKTSSPVAEAAE